MIEHKKVREKKYFSHPSLGLKVRHQKRLLVLSARSGAKRSANCLKPRPTVQVPQEVLSKCQRAAGLAIMRKMPTPVRQNRARFFRS